MIALGKIFEHDCNACSYSTTVNGSLQTQATDKIRMEKRVKQTNKFFLYFFTGAIPFCVCLDVVHTFCINVINDS